MTDPLVPPAHEKLSAFDPFALGTEAGLSAAFTYAGFLADDQPLSYSFIIPVPLMVALSGGPDSTALLAACIALREKLGLELTACHVNHHTRGPDSNHDQALCAELCRTWGIPLVVRHMAAVSQERPSESTLRDMRYSLLADAANEVGARFIGLAHTLNDQTETILFRLFRGTGLAGLAGMEAARRLNPGVILIRPLLSIPRRECIEYLRRLGVESTEDASNLDVGYTRNYIRHRIMPSIEERFPGFQERVEQLRQRVSAEEAFLKDMADEAFRGLQGLPTYSFNTWDLGVFRSLPIAIQRRLIARALKQRGVEVAFQRVTAVLEVIEDAAPLGSRLSLSAQWDVSCGGGLIRWIDKEAQEAGVLSPEMEYTAKVPGLTTIPLLGRALKVEPWARPDGETSIFPAATDWEAHVDLSEVSLPLVVRGRRAGDQIRPFGMDKLVGLKKYLHNRKGTDMRLGRRGPVCLVADREEVLWVPGVGLSNKLRVKDRPSHRLSWVLLAPDEIYFS